MKLTIEDLLCTLNKGGCVEYCRKNYKRSRESCEKFCKCMKRIYADTNKCRNAISKCEERHLA